MRILITADLHYDIARSRKGAEDLARHALDAGGDALVLLGDSAGADLDPLRRCLALFADFPGRKLLVPGNHCLWCRPGENSIDRYERVLPSVAAEGGFDVLDHAPVVLGDVGLVGSVGWYDYSLADESLGIPEAFYRAKMAPGSAGRSRRYRSLLDLHREQLTERQLAITARWMDGVRVNLGMEDEQFTELLADKLAAQLEAIRCRRIVACLHHLPFAQLVPHDRPDRFAFAAAFLGSRRFGEVLLACERVTHVYCGHSHWRERAEIAHLTVVNVGSTYTTKHLEVLDL